MFKFWRKNVNKPHLLSHSVREGDVISATMENGGIVLTGTVHFSSNLFEHIWLKIDNAKVQHKIFMSRLEKGGNEMLAANYEQIGIVHVNRDDIIALHDTEKRTNDELNDLANL